MRNRTVLRRSIGLIAMTLLFAACSGGGSSVTVTGSPATQTSQAGTSVSPEPPQSLAPLHGHYTPTISPADFGTVVDNPYWPLTPGTSFHYRGIRGTTPQTNTVTVTNQTKQILGITCTVVRDTVFEHGKVVERTFDWYAQDLQGNVWYMGEDSFELQNGHMAKASDSWESGVDGAQPGIIMPAAPQPGDGYRQEYYPPGQALDQAHVLRLDGSVTVPYGSYRGLLVTSERSPLEPQTEQKYYEPGLGEVEEKVVKGHHEEFKLVAITH
jgi:hypothetical protein